MPGRSCWDTLTLGAYDFVCRAKIPKEQAIENDTDEFVNRVFEGAVPLLFSALLRQKKMSKEELENLKQLIDEME